MRSWLLLLTITGVICAEPAPAEAHFALAPKLEIGPKEIEASATPLVESEDLTLTRADFLAHLERLTTLDTKYDRMQPGFWFPFELVRGIAFFHPENVHEVIDRLERVSARDRQALLVQWFGAQVEVFLGFRHLAWDDRADDVVMQMYGAGAKAEFLEELVVLGTMEPSVEGLETFVGSLPSAERRTITTGIEKASDQITPAEQQQAMRERWSRFRRDAVANADTERACGEIENPAAPPETFALRVGQHRLDLGDMHMLFGEPRTAKQWIAIRDLNCNRAAMLLALGDLAEVLGVVPERVERKIEASRALYASAWGIAEAIEPGATLADLQKIGRYPDVMAARDRFLERLEADFAKQPAALDEAFLVKTPWVLERTLAPQHSIHF